MARNTAAGLATPQEVPGELVDLVAKLARARQTFDFLPFKEPIKM